MERWQNLSFYDDVDLPKDSTYWVKRQAQFEKIDLREINAYEKELEKQFKKSFNQIKKEIQLYYKEFALENKITLREAKKWLSEKQIEEFKFKIDLLRTEMERSGVDQATINKYTSYTQRLKINRLQAILSLLDGELKVLYQDFNNSFTDLNTSSIKNGFGQQGYIMSQEIGIVIKMHGLDKRTIEEMLKIKWVENGNYSSRLWGEYNKFNKFLQDLLIQGAVMGESEKQLIEKLLYKYKVQYHEAQRLIRTESTYFKNQGIKKGYKETMIEEYQFYAMHPREIIINGAVKMKGSKICTQLDKKIMPLIDATVGANYPPIHPNCRSITGAVVTDAVIKNNIDKTKDRIALNPKITYEEYKRKYIRGN